MKITPYNLPMNLFISNHLTVYISGARLKRTELSNLIKTSANVPNFKFTPESLRSLHAFVNSIINFYDFLIVIFIN